MAADHSTRALSPNSRWSRRSFVSCLVPRPTRGEARSRGLAAPDLEHHFRRWSSPADTSAIADRSDQADSEGAECVLRESDGPPNSPLFPSARGGSLSGDGVGVGYIVGEHAPRPRVRAHPSGKSRSRPTRFAKPSSSTACFETATERRRMMRTLAPPVGPASPTMRLAQCMLVCNDSRRE
jgi:hypothetical protein